jgi:hypothetical protein
VKQASVETRRSQGLPVFGVRNERRWEELGVGLAKKLKWNVSGCLHVTHTRTHTREFDMNTAKPGVTGSTLLRSGCDRQAI